MQHELFEGSETAVEIDVPVSELKGVHGNPHAKKFFWDGNRFGVKKRVMGEEKILWFCYSHKNNRWWHDSRIENYDDYQTFSFSNTERVTG